MKEKDTTQEVHFESANRKGIKILVVEDDESFRNVLINILKEEGFEVRSADNGQAARHILTENGSNIDLVISDLHMPELDGVSVLKEARLKFPGIRFIMMSGESESIEARAGIEQGIDEFLVKPFEIKNLITCIENSMRRKDDKPPEMVEEDEFSFCKIHVDEFTSASALPSDIYVRLADNKYVKVGREGTEIQVHRIQTYKEKKVEYFYVHNKDFQKYAGFTLRLARAAIASKKITRQQKLKLFIHTGEILLTQIFIQNIRKEDIEFSQNVINNTLNLIGDEPEIFDLLSFLRTHSDANYAHSVAVSVFSSLIAKRMGWSSQQTLLKISLGGLFHDIGKKELPQSLLNKPRRDMNAEEVKLYESHSHRGKIILESLPGFPGDVIQIASQHHENNLGTGYPLGLNQKRIHPLAKIVYLTDQFFHLCQKYKGYEQKPWQSALKEMWEFRGAELEPLPLRALMETFDYPVPAPLLKIKPVG